MHVRIAGLGKCLPGIDVPGRIVDNTEIIDILIKGGTKKPGTDRIWTREEFTPELIEKLIGIKQRHWVADEVNTSDVALFAAEQAMAKAGMDWKDVGCLVIGSSTPEANYPSTACWVLNKALKKKVASGAWSDEEAQAFRIQAFDILAACTSSIYTLDLASKLLLFPGNEHRYALAIGAEVISRTLSHSDTNSDIFGDGGGAAVLERTEAPGHRILWTETGTDSWAAETTYSGGFDTRHHEQPVGPSLYMAGHEIQRYVLKLLPDLIQKMLDRSDRILGRKIGVNDIGLYICHQANGRIFEFPAKKLGIPIEKFFVNVDRRANCSSASVLMALAEAEEEGRLKAGDLVMLMGFGGGLTWGWALLEW